MQYIAFDSHKRYTFASVEDHVSGEIVDRRLEHERGALAEFLASCEPGSPVAVETIGNWYWIIDEIETAGMMFPASKFFRTPFTESSAGGEHQTVTDLFDVFLQIAEG